MLIADFAPMTLEDWQHAVLKRWPQAIFVDNADKHQGASILMMTNAVHHESESFIAGYAFEDISERLPKGTGWILVAGSDLDL